MCNCYIATAKLLFATDKGIQGITLNFSNGNKEYFSRIYNLSIDNDLLITLDGITEKEYPDFYNKTIKFSLSRLVDVVLDKDE